MADPYEHIDVTQSKRVEILFGIKKMLEKIEQGADYLHNIDFITFAELDPEAAEPGRYLMIYSGIAEYSKLVSGDAGTGGMMSYTSGRSSNSEDGWYVSVGVLYKYGQHDVRYGLPEIEMELLLRDVIVAVISDNTLGGIVGMQTVHLDSVIPRALSGINAKLAMVVLKIKYDFAANCP